MLIDIADALGGRFYKGSLRSDRETVPVEAGPVNRRFMGVLRRLTLRRAFGRSQFTTGVSRVW